MAKRRLPPWEEITYFLPPKVSYPVVAGGVGWVPIVTANPQRVVLIISVNSIIGVTTDPTISTSGGMLLSSNYPNLEITEAKHGSLCTSDWYASSTGAVNITVTEVILRQWPEEDSR